MHIRQVHPPHLKMVSTPKHWTSATERVFCLWLREAIQPTANGEVEEPIA